MRSSTAVHNYWHDMDNKNTNEIYKKKVVTKLNRGPTLELGACSYLKHCGPPSV